MNTRFMDFSLKHTSKNSHTLRTYLLKIDIKKIVFFQNKMLSCKLHTCNTSPGGVTWTNFSHLSPAAVPIPAMTSLSLILWLISFSSSPWIRHSFQSLLRLSLYPALPYVTTWQVSTSSSPGCLIKNCWARVRVFPRARAQTSSCLHLVAMELHSCFSQKLMSYSSCKPARRHTHTHSHPHINK